MPPQIVLTLAPNGVQLQVPPSVDRNTLVMILLDTVKAVACGPPPVVKNAIEVPSGEVAAKLLDPVG